MTARDFPEYLALRWQQQSLFLAAERSFYSFIHCLAELQWLQG